MVIEYYNKRINIPHSIILLMEDIYKKSSLSLNIYECYHVYKETNRTSNCLAKKGISILESNI